MIEPNKLDQSVAQAGMDSTTSENLLAAVYGKDEPKAGIVDSFVGNARASFVAPAESVAELIDRGAGTHSARFMEKVAGMPEAPDSRLAWAFGQAGSALGMTPWMLLLHRSASLGLTAMTGSGSLSALEKIGVSTVSGLAYGLALTPTGSGDKDWLTHRLQNGLASGLSFGTLAGVTESLAANTISNRAFAGIVSGIPAGLVDAGTRYETGQTKTFEPLNTVGTYSFLGGVFGVVSPYGKAAEAESGSGSGRSQKSELIAPSVDKAPVEIKPSVVKPETIQASESSGALEATKPKVGYIGFFLDDASASRVQQPLKIGGQELPLRWTPANSFHVTEQFGVKSDAGENWAGGAKGTPRNIRVVGHAVDNTGVEALVVTVDGKSQRADGEYYHMTRSLAEGRKANESMEVIQKALAVQKALAEGNPAQTGGNHVLAEGNHGLAEGNQAQVNLEDAQRYLYTALKPEEQFDLQTEPRFRVSDSTPKAVKVESVKVEVPFESMAPKMQVISALKNTPPDYLARTIETRTPEHRAGSYFDMSADQLKQALFRAKWEPYNPLDDAGNPIIGGGARGYRATIDGGRLGMTPIDKIGDDARLYLIDPKATGKWSVSTVGAAEPHTDHVTMIVGQDEDSGKQIVWTFHPGEPVRPSMLDTEKLKALLADAGVKTDGLPESGPGRRIEITKAQLEQINAGLPESSKMTLAKIEADANIDAAHKTPEIQPAEPLKAIPNAMDRTRFEQALATLPEDVKTRYEKALEQAVKNPQEVSRTTAVRGLTFEMTQLQRTMLQGLETIALSPLVTQSVTYRGFGRNVSDFSAAPQELKKSTIQLDYPLERGDGAPHAYEIKSSPRMVYGSDAQQRNQILKYQQAINDGVISGATVEVTGRISPELVHWLNGKTVGDASAAPDVEVLYTMPLPSGGDYTFILKRAENNNGLHFTNDDRAYTAEDKRVISGAYKAIQDRSIGELISGVPAVNIAEAPSELAGHLQDPMKITDLAVFNQYDSLRLQSIWKSLETKADADRINAANPRNATSEYNTRDYIEEATRWYQDYLKQNPQSGKAKQAYQIRTEQGIENVVDRAFERAQAIKAYEEARAVSPEETQRRLERAAMGYTARPEGISLDMEHIIMDSTAEENKGGSRRGRSYDNPERFITVDKVLDYLNGQDRHTIDAQIYDPQSGSSINKNNISEKEVTRTVSSVDGENLQRARQRVADIESRYNELHARTDLNSEEAAELRVLNARNTGWNMQKTAIQKIEGQIDELIRERKAAGFQNKGPEPGQSKDAFIEQVKQRAVQYDAQINALNKQLQQRYQEVIGGQAEWNKIAKRVDVQHNNIIKFMYAATADGTVPLTEEVLRGEVTGRAAHSELAQGRNVYGAGELVFAKDDSSGKWYLSEINNASGHYRPPGADTLVYVRNLVQQSGVDTSRAILNDALQRGTPLVDAHLMDGGSVSQR